MECSWSQSAYRWEYSLFQPPWQHLVLSGKGITNTTTPESMLISFCSCLILIIVLGVIAGYTGYVIGQFKLVHPSCHNMADAGYIMFGPIGRELFGIGQMIVLIFIMAAHITSFAIMMNVETNHGTCSIIFSVIALALSFALTLPRTLKSMSWLSAAC